MKTDINVEGIAKALKENLDLDLEVVQRFIRRGDAGDLALGQLYLLKKQAISLQDFTVAIGGACPDESTRKAWLYLGAYVAGQFVGLANLVRDLSSEDLNAGLTLARLSPLAVNAGDKDALRIELDSLAGLSSAIGRDMEEVRDRLA